MKDNLPYHIPTSTNEQLKFLAKITDIPANLIQNGGVKEVEAIASVILYRHMNRHQRIEAMTLIRSVSNRALMGTLITKVLDTTYVNPQWGVWSLSTNELESDINFHTAISDYAGYIGVGASALSGKDLVKEVWSLKKLGRRHWLLLVIWGSVYFNSRELNKAKKELNRRQTTNHSRLY